MNIMFKAIIPNSYIKQERRVTNSPYSLTNQSKIYVK